MIRPHLETRPPRGHALGRDLRADVRRDAGPRARRPRAAGEGARGPRAPARPPQPLEPVVEGRRRGAVHRPARGADRRPRPDRRPLRAPLPDGLAQGRARLLDPRREAARRGVRAGRADARLPLDRQLRDRRRLGRPAHGLPLARGAARGDERRALREDPRLRGGRDRDAGQRVERQGDLRQGPRAARGAARTGSSTSSRRSGTTASTSTAPRRRREEVVGSLGLEAGAFVSAMGSAGTIAAGEGLRAAAPATCASWPWSRCSARRSTTSASAPTASRASATST